MTDSLPLPANDELPPEVVQRLSERPPLNVYRMLANIPQCLIPWTDTVKALYQGALSSREREIAIVRQAARADAHYEFHQHRLVALAAGVSESEIDILKRPGQVTSLSERENLICAIADQLEDNARLDDATYTKARKEFGDKLFAELVLAISFYAGVARFLNGARVEVESGNPLEGRTSPN